MHRRAVITGVLVGLFSGAVFLGVGLIEMLPWNAAAVWAGSMGTLLGFYTTRESVRREQRTPEQADTERLVERIMRLPVEQRQELAHLVSEKILANWDREQAGSGELP